MINKKKDIKSIIYAPISLGELLDKITILQIKKEKTKGDKQTNVVTELTLLIKILEDINLPVDNKLIEALKKINSDIWNIEDKIRSKENLKEYDEEFINLARAVYKTNDKRAAIKKEINQNYNSQIIEEKLYIKYD